MNQTLKLNNKATLVIDGQWYLRSRFSVIRKDNPTCTFTGDIQADRNLLMSKLTMDLCAEIRNCAELIDDIVIVADYSSWRKKVTTIVAPWDAASVDPTETYKSHRVYDESINWLETYKLLNDWGQLLESKFNIAYLKAYGAEGDDIIAIITKQLNAVGRNAIILATDGDMTQCSSSNENGTYTALYRKCAGTKKNYYKGFNMLITDDPLRDAIVNFEAPQSMFDFNPSASAIPTFMKQFFKEINAHQIPAFLFYKVLMGDGGDNVSEIMTRKGGKNNFHLKLNHIGDALNANCLAFDTLKIEHLYDKNVIEGVIEHLHKNFMKMLTYPAEYKEYYINKFVENRKLMFLDEREIPTNVTTAIKQVIADKASILANKALLSSMTSYVDVLSEIGVKNAISSSNTIADDFFNVFGQSKNIS
jgi:5'-3' exonuclease